MWKLECLLKYLYFLFGRWYKKVKTINTRKCIERSRTPYCFLPDYIKDCLDKERPYWGKQNEC